MKNLLSYASDQINTSQDTLQALYDARETGRAPITKLEERHEFLVNANIERKEYSLISQGDSWFDYPGDDLINYLRDRHGHTIKNIAVAGATMNDIAYGLVPKNWLGIRQSHDVLRMAELIFLMEKEKPNAVLLSGGGNDIAGPEFFSFINNADSGLPEVNHNVLRGVVLDTIKEAYQDVVTSLIQKAVQLKLEKFKIFIHGYDYPWPDGRGFTAFNFVGPWFHDSFNKKNYPLDNDGDLRQRRNIVKAIIDEFNAMLQSLSANNPNTVCYVNLRGKLPNQDDWANELHPTTQGFEALSDEFNLALHKAMP
jgi:lysophospholipase L1-like esterase